jgi:hypothetical protein
VSIFQNLWWILWWIQYYSRKWNSTCLEGTRHYNRSGTWHDNFRNLSLTGIEFGLLGCTTATPTTGLCPHHQYGIIHYRTHPYSPQLNGVAERKNRTLTYFMNYMLATSSLWKGWWAGTLLTSSHVLNRVSNKNKEKPLTRSGLGKNHHFHITRAHGMFKKVNILIRKKHKLGAKTVDCIF